MSLSDLVRSEIVRSYTDQEPGSETNSLSTILTHWFGPDVGRPDTNNYVMFERMADGYRMRPAGERLGVSAAAGIIQT